MLSILLLLFCIERKSSVSHSYGFSINFRSFYSFSFHKVQIFLTLNACSRSLFLFKHMLGFKLISSTGERKVNVKPLKNVKWFLKTLEVKAKKNPLRGKRSSSIRTSHPAERLSWVENIIPLLSACQYQRGNYKARFDCTI